MGQLILRIVFFVERFLGNAHPSLKNIADSPAQLPHLVGFCTTARMRSQGSR